MPVLADQVAEVATAIATSSLTPTSVRLLEVPSGVDAKAVENMLQEVVAGGVAGGVLDGGVAGVGGGLAGEVGPGRGTVSDVGPVFSSVSLVEDEFVARPLRAGMREKSCPERRDTLVAGPA